MFTSKKQPQPSPNQQPNSAAERFGLLHRLLQAARQTNRLLCSIRDQHSGDDSSMNAVESSLTAVLMSGDVQRIAAQNPERTALWICNVSDKNLMIGPAALDISSSLFSAVIKPNETFKMSINDNRMYRKGIYGFWKSGAQATSKAMITEFFDSDDSI